MAPAATPVTAGASDVLCPAGSPLRLRVPTSEADAAGWTDPELDDGGWQPGRAPVGYDRGTGYEGIIATDLSEAMDGRSATVYLRVPFAWTGGVEYDELRLRARYDDGFVVFINGQRVAERGAPDPLTWSSTATATHADSLAVQFEEIPLAVTPGSVLRAGSNLLAIHGLNRAASNSDFLLDVELVGTRDGVASVPLDRTAEVRARRLVEGEWSPLAAARFVVDTGLRISEVMYHPPDPTPGERGAGIDDADEFEFLELLHTGSDPLHLAGYRLSDGVTFEFGDEWLAPGERLVVVENRAAFLLRYPSAIGDDVRIAGPYSGRLANDRERIALEAPTGVVLLDFTYDDAWHPATDGEGRSLVLVDLRTDPMALGDPASWSESPEPLGTPGRGE